ncbi:nuclear transport factor 2 family protein [Streptomyces roseoverticillatus]|uniref:nuclear transport factor 2 family protein n=1 Tax=Streptomyces roseoverticillatus TaxID=66429 RepID=UPI0033FC6353
MTLQQDELAALSDRVRELGDRAAVNELLDRYIVLLDNQDENGFDGSWPSTVFTDDVRMIFPVGACEGLSDVARLHFVAKNRFDRSLHVSSNHIVTLDGDRADVRLHVLATHVHHPGPENRPNFDIGGYYEGEAVRTAVGWRLRTWAFHLVWSTGPGPDGCPLG